jgi:flagellar assembly factor FliW
MFMIVDTKRFGQLEIDDSKIITFINGLMGFENLKKYALIDHPGTNILKWLQSMEDSHVSLPVVDPTAFFPDYAPIISQDELKALKIQDHEQAISICIITVPQDVQKATINLKAPIVLNLSKRLADQVIAENQEYLVRHPLNLKKVSQRRCEGC